jgi:hypothetical protein
MAVCIYCDVDKDATETSREHSIPEFLGGAYAPDRFKVDRACKRCNNLLGLFVDGSFARTWWVSNWLSQAARSAYDPSKPNGLPLICMGITELEPPGIQPGEVCELWLGPLGEQVYWIRPQDERFFWYSGGDPIATKRFKTRAYFLFAERSNLDTVKTWLSFRDAFSGERVTKIMCTAVAGADPKDIGFSMADALDRSRVAYFIEKSTGEPSRVLTLKTKPDYDHRFMAKLALGVGYSLFGDDFLRSNYAKELRKGVWFRAGEMLPLVRGQPALQAPAEPNLLRLTGLKDAVTLVIFPVQDELVLILNIGQQLSWKVVCADAEMRDSPARSWVDSGQAIVMYKYLQKGLLLLYPNFIGHVSGSLPNDELTAIEQRLRSAPDSSQ